MAAMHRPLPAAPASAQRGLSLVELMVGVAIGMIGVLVIFQTLAVWDKHTQTTSAGSDAQVAGTLAMYSLERDLKLGGFGFGTATPPDMGCRVAGTAINPPAILQFPLEPVTINRDPGGGPDTIDVLHGNSAFFVTRDTFTNATATTLRVTRRGGFMAGDVAVIAGNASASAASASCRLLEITNASDPDGVTVQYGSGTYASFYRAGASAPVRFNPAAASAPGFVAGTIYSLGPRPERNTWSLDTTKQALVSTDMLSGFTRQVAENVVDLRAQYGVDGAPRDGAITESEWVNAAPVDRTTILAVRVALLVRNRQYEKGGDAPFANSASAPSWSGGPFRMTNVDGTRDSFRAGQADPNNWRYYRYNVFERVIPLRNLVWGSLVPVP